MKTDALAIARNSQSASFQKLNPQLFKQMHENDAPKGKRRKEMNKTEADFERFYKASRMSEYDIAIDYEGITLRWPDGMRYTPDFAVYRMTDYTTVNKQEHVMTPITLIEVKGAYAWAKDVVKFRAARDKWCDRFKFEFWQKVDGIWQETR